MKKLTFVAAAAAVFVALGTSAVAQDTTKKEAKGEVAKMPTVASVVIVVDSSHAVAAKVGMVTAETPLKIEVVDVKPLFTGKPDEKTLKDAIEKNEDAIKHLRSELKKNDLIVKAVDGHALKPEIGDVVGVELLDGDRLVIYFWKK
jgi:hypothetical protein